MSQEVSFLPQALQMAVAETGGWRAGKWKWEVVDRTRRETAGSAQITVPDELISVAEEDTVFFP